MSALCQKQTFGSTGRLIFLMERGRLWGGAASCLIAEQPWGFGGWGGRSTNPTLRPHQSDANQHLVEVHYALV
jgi:hypothetical protein